MPLSQGGAMNPRQVIRKLRIVWAAMLFSLGLYTLVLLRIHRPAVIHLERTVQVGIALLGIVTGVVVLYLRFIRIANLIASAGSMDDKTLAAQANYHYLLCYVFSQAVALYGFVLAFLHGDHNIYVPLFLGGLMLMLLCYPRLPANGSPS